MKAPLLVFLLLLVSGLSAQDGPPAGTIAARHFQDANEALIAKEYRKAIRYYKNALEAQPSLTVAHRLIGQCHELMSQYPEAANSYRQVIKADSLFSRIMYYQLGDVYYKMGEPEIALTYFEQYQRYQELPVEAFGLHGVDEMAEELILRDRLASSIRACEISIDSVKFINVTEIYNLGRGVNSKYDDYFPFLTNDQQRLFFTRQRADGDEDLFVSDYRNGQWRNAERIRNFNTDSPEGMSTLVRNGRKVFFTACLRDSVGGPCDIWEALVDGATIQDINKLGAPINSAYWESQAAISCDGSRLFFSSNRPGGLGGTDIYMTEKMENGRWSLPVNLGAPVNTPGDEEAPFISNDGQTLYFSSTGHLGLGEQDIFMVWWDERLERWSVPINIGPPVNGPHRELGFFLSADGKTGYFASNRPGGEGAMDIYRFELSEKLFGEPITFVEGRVLDSVLLSPVPGLVHINGRSPIFTDPDGVFFLCAGAEETLDMEVAVDTYHPYHNQFFIPEWENKTFYPVDLFLQPTLSFLAEIDAQPKAPPPIREEAREHIINHSIFFGFDSAELQGREVERLEALVESLQEREVIRVEIVGYADDIGTNAYNLQLSEDRAKHTAVFLLSRSIEIDDIHIQGKGSITTDEEPKSRNRRVDIRITVQQEQ